MAAHGCSSHGLSGLFGIYRDVCTLECLGELSQIQVASDFSISSSVTLGDVKRFMF